MSDASGSLAALRSRSGEMLESLAALVRQDSPSLDIDALRRCGDVVAGLGSRLTGQAPEELVADDGRPHLRWRFGPGEPRVLLLGHFDTVWSVGTAARWPFVVSDGVACGPGVFDMKAGIVQLFFALSMADQLDGVSVLLTSDEEMGAPTSRELIQEEARGTEAVLVLEPSADGALKTARKGPAAYEVRVTGRAAHAGLDPEKGANATIELASQILRIKEMADPELGTTVTPTVISGGVTPNTVPDMATVHVDVRSPTTEEQERVEASLRALSPTVPGCSVEVTSSFRVPPLEASASAELFERVQSIAQQLSLPPLAEAHVGGGSDGNLTAAMGIPTLDGLGAVGGKAHAEGEYVVTHSMPERAAIVGELAKDLRELGPLSLQ